MSTNNGSTSSRPDLGHLRHQARDLQRAADASDPAALRRLIIHHPRFSGLSLADAVATPVRLADAQLVIARESGYASWPRMKRALTDAPPEPEPARLLSADLDDNRGRAAAILGLAPDGLPSIVALIRRSHPAYRGATDAEIRAAALTEDDGRLIYARDHGFPDWESLAAHIVGVAAGGAQDLATHAVRHDLMIYAVQSVRDDDLQRLDRLIVQDRGLATARGTNDNTLLAIAAGAGRKEIVRLLLAYGADANAANNRGWTPLHSAYGNPEVLRLLLAAGASTDRFARGDGGTALVMALFWGRWESADLLAGHGIAPLNLRVAAGLGRRDLVATFFDAAGHLTPEAGAHRGFYRPHGGFPLWKTANRPQEILDEAFTYACRNGRVEVLGDLLDQGANIDADPYRGTGLIWAAVNGHVEVIAWLLDHGAAVDKRGTFGGPTHGHGVTALHMAAGSGQLAATRLLVERRADVALRDDLHGGSAVGWADFWGHGAIRDYLGTVCTLEDAARFGYVDRVRSLLAAGQGTEHAPPQKTLDSALLAAVVGNQPAIVLLLLEGGADRQTRDTDGRAATDVARHAGYGEIVEIMLRGSGTL